MYGRAVVTRAVPPAGPTDMAGQMNCPQCQMVVVTDVRYIIGLMSWVLCGTILLFMGICCFFIPLILDSCKDVEHRCPNCKRVLYVHKRL
ncbi:hypothetical protein DPEC_G00170480 [Dallia pectoralis]|uniref:Uncharacterized protein n=1 Tax=Dallia pectoralis TaxID=75939 RepID=A0ACC2GD46_DALPE|nr:hypothetical protein DPEC_G00170480 [Dallia pectoralis]